MRWGINESSSKAENVGEEEKKGLNQLSICQEDGAYDSIWNIQLDSEKVLLFQGVRYPKPGESMIWKMAVTVS